MRNRRSTLFGAFLFFLTITVVVMIAVLIYAAIANASGGNVTVISLAMLGVILVLAAVCTLADRFRRVIFEERPVRKILEATNKIATGDFSVQLETNHPYGRYDAYDWIIENLNKMAAELSKTEILRADFIANVSHESKTPLSIIQNYVTALHDCNLTEDERKDYMNTLVVTTKRLSLLISNILKLNKLENQELKNDCESVNLSEQLAETVLGFEEAIEEKGLELECDFDEDVKAFASPAYLEIVWNNLLSNAIKFTDRGGRIGVTLRQENGRAVVKVADTGCGISADTGKHIFEKFYQGDTSHAQEGNGLGLALVKRVIDIMGGTIGVSSEIGKGTTFTVAFKTEV